MPSTWIDDAFFFSIWSCFRRFKLCNTVHRSCFRPSTFAVSEGNAFYQFDFISQDLAWKRERGRGGDGGCSLLWREQKTIYFIISEIKWPDLNSMASGTLFVRQQILQHIVMIAMKSILNNDVIWAPIHTTQYQTSTSSVAKSDFYLLSMNHVYTTHSTWNSLIYFKCFSFIECSRFDVSQSDEKRQTFAGKRTVALFELNATNRRDEK